MTQCEKVRKGYVVDNGKIYHGYICQKEKAHNGNHEFYHDELNLPVFKKIHDADLYQRFLDKKAQQNNSNVS